MDELTDRLLRLTERLQEENEKLRADNERLQGDLRTERARTAPIVVPQYPQWARPWWDQTPLYGPGIWFGSSSNQVGPLEVKTNDAVHDSATMVTLDMQAGPTQHGIFYGYSQSS